MMSFERVFLLVEKLIKPLQIPLNPTELFICHSFNKGERGPTRTRTTHNFFNWKTDFCSIENGAFFQQEQHITSSIGKQTFVQLKMELSSIDNTLFFNPKQIFSSSKKSLETGRLDPHGYDEIHGGFCFFSQCVLFPSRSTEALSFDTEDPPYSPLHANFYTRTTQLSLVAALWPTIMHTHKPKSSFTRGKKRKDRKKTKQPFAFLPQNTLSRKNSHLR